MDATAELVTTSLFSSMVFALLVMIIALSKKESNRSGNGEQKKLGKDWIVCRFFCYFGDFTSAGLFSNVCRNNYFSGYCVTCLLCSLDSWIADAVRDDKYYCWLLYLNALKSRTSLTISRALPSKSFISEQLWRRTAMSSASCSNCPISASRYSSDTNSF